MSILQKRVLILRTLFVVALFVRPCVAANPIYEALIDNGIEISTQETIKLPPPVLGDGLDQDQQHKAIESIVAGKYDWESFTRKSLVGPFILKINDDGHDVGKIGRRVDLFFVTYGSIAQVADNNYLQDQLNLAGTNEQDADGRHIKTLSADELRSRGITSSQSATDPKWIAVESVLLSKVRINLTTQNLKTESNDSVVIASVADPRFVADSEYPNCWRSLSNDDAGKRQIGPPQPYTGLASYAKITRLAQPAGALFVEYHVAFAEPVGWFHGSNLLRSKLPIVAQDMTRKFRRNTSEH